MPTPYCYVLDQAADEMMSAISRRERLILQDFFRLLASHPFTPGDQEVVDANGRLNQVKGVGRFVVTFRPDHLTAEVRIAAVELS